METKNINLSIRHSVMQNFRAKRFAFFLNLLKKMDLDRPIQILDIGGTESYWENMNFANHPNIHITLLNLFSKEVKNNNFTSVKGDACDLSIYQDKQFDIVYSNSVIEHLFSMENQKRMADEVRRVGKCYYIQTPNYYFPIEPHWLFPFFQFLPFKVRVLLTNHFSLGNRKKSINKEDAINKVNEVKLLTQKKMKNLFPEGEVYLENFFGLTKSITMYNFTRS